MSFFDELDFLYPGEFGDTVVNMVKAHILQSLDKDFCLGYQLGSTNNHFFDRKLDSGFLSSYVRGGNNPIVLDKYCNNFEIENCGEKEKSKYHDTDGVLCEPVMRFNLGDMILREVSIMEGRDIKRRGEGNGFSTSIFTNPQIVAYCELIKQELIRKDSLLVNLKDHYKNIKIKNKKVSSFCISFGMMPSVKISPWVNEYSVSAHLATLAKTLKEFFNLVRNRAVFAYIVGYFWVTMMGVDGVPYIHLNFYVNNDSFGQSLAEEINDVWMKVSDKTGYVAHYTHRLKFNILGMTNFDIQRFGLDSSIYLKMDKETHRVPVKKKRGSREFIDSENITYYFDLNGKESTRIKHLASAQNKELFIPYLRCIAMEAFHYPGKRMFGLSRVRKKEVKRGKFPRRV